MPDLTLTIADPAGVVLSTLVVPSAHLGRPDIYQAFAKRALQEALLALECRDSTTTLVP